MHTPTLHAVVVRSVVPSFKRRLIARFGLLAVLAVALDFCSDQARGAQALGLSTDIGSVPAAGASSYASATDTYQLTGTGTGIGGSADAFHFAYYQAVCGDGWMTVRLASADALAGAALVLRGDLEADAASVAIRVDGGTARLIHRDQSGGNSAQGASTSASAPVWLRLARSGVAVTASISADGENWTSLGGETIDLEGATIYAGLAVSNGSAASVTPAAASFSGLQSTFLPAGGLMLWLKGDAGVTQDTSHLVSAWADQSDHAYNAFQNSASNRPLAVPEAINGWPALRFDGSGHLQLPAGFSDFTQGATALVVARPTAANAWQRFFELANGPSVDSIVFTRYSSGSQFLFECVNGNGSLVAQAGSGPGVIDLDKTQLFAFSQNGSGGTATLYKNGQALATQSAGAIANITRTQNLIGWSNWGNSRFQGDIAEIVLFDHALTNTDRQTWENYLNEKYRYHVPPNAPTQLTVTMLSPTRLSLSWTGASQDVAGYQVERRNTDSTWSIIATLPGSAAGYVDSGLISGNSYTYRVTASNDAGASPATIAVTGATISPGSGGTPSAQGALLWLRADIGVVLDAAGGVSFWADQSSQANDAFQASAPARPQVQAASINGLPAIHFDGSASYLQLPSGFSDFTQGISALVVTRPTDTGFFAHIFDLGNGAGSNNVLLGRNGSSTSLEFFSNAPAIHVLAPDAITQNAPQLFEYVQDTQAGRLYKNAVLLASAGAGVLNPATRTNNFLGKSSWSGDALFQGDIAELVIFDHALTAAERQSWESYLNTKYQYAPPPSTPAGLSATPLSATQAAISWQRDVQNATGYSLERRESGQSDEDFVEIAAIAGGQVGAFIDENLGAAQSYIYRLRAYNTVGYSGYSPLATVSLPAGGALSASLPAIDDLVLWLRPDQGIIKDAGGFVSSWCDASGRGNNVSAAQVSGQPHWMAGSVNGQSAVRFDGANDSLRVPIPVVATGGNATILTVVRAPDANLHGSLVQIGDGNGFALGLGNTTLNDDGNNLTGLYEYVRWLNSGQALGFEPAMAELSIDAGGTATFYRNGENKGVLTGSAPRTPTAATLIGGNPFESRYFRGDMAEVLVFERNLTNAERRTWENYLNAKYNLIPLPSQPAQASASALSSTQAVISWAKPASEVTGYRIERQNPDGTWSVITVLGANASSYTINGLNPGAQYTYRVIATNMTGDSPAASLSVTTTSFGAAVPLANLRLWLQAGAGVVANNNSISLWRDQSGRGNDAYRQADAWARPTLLAGALNGRPAVRFDGDDQLDLPPGLMAGATAGEMFVVVRSTAAANTRNGLAYFGSQPYGRAYYPEGDGHIHDCFGSTNLWDTGQPGADLTQFRLYDAASTSAEWSCRLDGVAQFSSLLTGQANTVAFTNNPVLGTSHVGLQGDIAEILVFDRTLVPGERAILARYFTLRYAQSGLLGGDPLADEDGDGRSRFQEYLDGTDPLDYFNGQAPRIVVVSGNNQSGSAATLLAQPLTVRVTAPTGAPLVNAPVAFAVTRGGSGLVADPSSPANRLKMITVRTTADGLAQVLFQAPGAPLRYTSLVTATSGYANRVNHVTFAAAVVFGDSTNGDGIPDGWKLQHGLDLTADTAITDTDGDGVSDRQEYYLHSDPASADFTAGGVPFAWMLAHGLDPRYDTDQAIDPNGQGLSYAEEYHLEQSTIDLWRCNEGGPNTTIVSTLGRQDSGVLVNGASWTADPDGGAALLLGQTAAQVDFSIAADGHLDFAASQSFSLTARFRTTATGIVRLMGKGAEAESDAAGYFLGLDNGRLFAGIGSDNAQSPALGFLTNAAYNDSQWHHAAAVFDRPGHLARLYVDGILQEVTVADGSGGSSQGTSVDYGAATGLSASRANMALVIGAVDLGGMESFAGSIDNVGLFSKALTPAEIKALAGRQNNLPPSVFIDNPLPASTFSAFTGITISAQASAPLGTISKVEFFEGTTKLGESDTYPYAMTWSQVSLGAHTLTARAVDNRGAVAVSPPVSVTALADSDHDGLPDAWEIQYFGNLNQDAGGSFLGDGMSNLVKYRLGLDPTRPTDSSGAAAAALGLQVYTPLH